jgi:methylthioribose-1-phosphate isomerase
VTTAEPIPPTIEWRDGKVRLIDQRRLPGELVFLDVATVDDLCDAIRTLAVRGAPALGVAGAMGVALASVTGEPVEEAARRIVATRPTAVNLAWGVERALAAADPVAGARRLAADDLERNRRLGAHGAELVPEGGRVYTHCNAGALACAGYGTALGVVRAAFERGRRPTVWVGETRPALQGARLTAWELDRLGIPATLVADVMAGSLMAGGEPVATIDPGCPTGADIPIERRGAEEVTALGGVRVAPAGIEAENRAFDVTPAALVTAIVTEEGVATAPYEESLARVCRTGVS